MASGKSHVAEEAEAASQPAPQPGHAPSAARLDIVSAKKAVQQENFSTFRTVRVKRNLLERFASDPRFFDTKGGAMVGKMLQNDPSETLTLTVSRLWFEEILTNLSHQQALREHGIFSGGESAGSRQGSTSTTSMLSITAAANPHRPR